MPSRNYKNNQKDIFSSSILFIRPNTKFEGRDSQLSKLFFNKIYGYRKVFFILLETFIHYTNSFMIFIIKMII